MKTTHRTRYGPPEVIRLIEVDPPRPADDEVLVRVHATTVNRTDCAALTGRPLITRAFTGVRAPRRTATGTDLAGEVIATGRDVTGWSAGDRVWAFDDNGLGSHAEIVALPARAAIARIPEGFSEAEAAASAEGAHYAVNFLNKVRLEPGGRVLVNGATGAIGSALVQLSKAQGAHVTAVCGPGHEALMRSIGADVVIDRSRDDFTRGDARYDLVFDSVGKRTFGACRRVLTAQGTYISSEFGSFAQNLALSIVTRPGGRRVVFPVPSDIPATLRRIGELAVEGRFRPLIDRTFPLDQVQEAFRYVASGQKIGNVILAMPPGSG